MSEKAPQTINLVLNLGPRGSIVEFNLSEMSTDELEQNPDYIGYKCSENILRVRLSACDSCRQPIKINIFSIKNKTEPELQVVNEPVSEEVPEVEMDQDEDSHNYWQSGESSESCKYADPLDIKPEPIQSPKQSSFDQNPVQCPQCGLKFMSQHYLQMHLALIHNGTSAPKIPTTVNPKKLKINPVKPEVKQQKTYKSVNCPHCGRPFVHKQYLTRHLQTGCFETTNSEGLHVCKGCKKPFKFRQGLAKHIRERPECRSAGITKDITYSCECGLDFDKVRDRNTHCATTGHRKKPEKRNEASTNNEAQQLMSLECPHCNRTFSHRQDLAMHLKTGCFEKPVDDAGFHVCVGCNHSYKYRQGLSKHIRESPECRDAGLKRIGGSFSCDEFDSKEKNDEHVDVE